MKNARLDFSADCDIINMKRALPISGLLRELDFYMDRNRHLAEWRFLRFTVIVMVKEPICTVKVIGIKLTPLGRSVADRLSRFMVMLFPPFRTSRF